MTTRAKSTKNSKSKSTATGRRKPAAAAGKGGRRSGTSSAAAGKGGRRSGTSSATAGKGGRRSGTSSAAADPTSDAALLALSADYAGGPDMPVKVAQEELASLARLGKTAAGPLAKVGIAAAQIETLQRFATRLGSLETAWQRARTGVTLTAVERRRLVEAEELDKQLLAGGRWALRKDSEAQAELGRIAEGSGLADTIQDLRALVEFWTTHREALPLTDITAKDLARATELAAALSTAAAKEDASVQAGAAQELRNRCFWAADELAREIREGGRYAYRLQPKTAAKFTSRYRATVGRRWRNKPKDATPPAPPPTA